MTNAYATDSTIIIEWYDGDAKLQWCCGYSDTAPEIFEWETVGSVAHAASDY